MEMDFLLLIKVKEVLLGGRALAHEHIQNSLGGKANADGHR